MTFGSSMAPQPQVGAGQQGTETNPDLVNRWMSFLAHPATQAGLLQFAASVLQPVGMGQSPLGQIGLALGDAGAAAGRVTAEQQQEQQRLIENQQSQEKLKLQSRGVAAEEQRAGTDAARAATEAKLGEKNLGISQQRIDLEKERIKNELIASQGQLGISQQQLTEMARHNLAQEDLAKQDNTSQAQLRAAESQYYLGQGRQTAASQTPAERAGVALLKGYMEDWRMNNPEATPQQEAEAYQQARQIYLPNSMEAQPSQVLQPATPPGQAAAPGAPPSWEVISKDKAMLEDLKKQPQDVQDRAVQYYRSIDPKYDLQKLLGPKLRQVPYTLEGMQSPKPGETVQLQGKPPVTYDAVVKKYGNPGLVTDAELDQLKKDMQLMSDADLEKLNETYPKLRERLLGKPGSRSNIFKKPQSQ